MKTKLRFICVAALCAMLTACQTRSEKPVIPSEGLAKLQEVSITEMEPDDQLYKALETFSRGEYKQCVADIKEAATSMRTIAATADQTRKHAIEKAAESLDRQADKVAKNQVQNIAALYQSFGQTGRALAGNRLTITENEYFNHSEEKSGALLAKTIQQLERSIAYHHRDLSVGEKQILDDALHVATQLEKGNKVDEDDLKATLQNIDNEIDKWNNEFEAL